MERSWWWKAALYGVVVVIACVYLVPTVFPDDEKKPPPAAVATIKKYFHKRSQEGLDLQGGLHLVYEVHVEKAVSDKVDRIASDVEERLKKDKKVADVVVNREDRADIVVIFKTPAEQVKIDDDMMRDFRRQLDVVSRDPVTGTVRLRLDADQEEEVRDLALRQAIETIRGRVDQFGVAEPTIVRKGTDIVVELPGLKPADFERIKTIIGKTAQLEFKIVDDGAEWTRKVAPLAHAANIDVKSEQWSEKDSGKVHE